MADAYKTKIDPVTGFPKEDKPLDPIRGSFLIDQQNKAELMKASIASESGQAMLRMVEEHLLMRVKILMNGDSECKVLIRILSDIGSTIDLGQVAVKRLMRMVTKK